MSWNWMRWMWMGWASTVRLRNSQTSVEPTRGSSVIQMPWPNVFSLEPGTGASGGFPARSRMPRHLVLLMRSSTGWPAGLSSSNRTSCRVTRGCTPGASWPATGSASRLRRCKKEPRRRAGMGGERFGQTRQLDRSVQKTAVGADLPEGRPLGAARRVGQPHPKEAGVGRVDDPEAIAARLDIEVGPAASIDTDDIPEELRDPVRMEARIPGRTVNERGVGRAVRKQQLAVGVELAVLDHQLDLLRAGREPQRVVRSPGVVLVADEIEGGQPREHVDACDPKRVVVEPQRGGLLVVGILVHRRVGGGRDQGAVPPPVASIGGEPGLGSPVERG